MELNIKNSKNEDLAYKILSEISNLDVKLMWDRTNVLLVLQGGLLAFLGSNYNSHNLYISFAISAFGIIISVLWWRVTKGGSFWVTHWEERMRKIEELTFGDEIKIYRDHPSATKDAKLIKQFKKQGYISTRKSLLFISLTLNLIWIFLSVYYFILIVGG